MGGFRMFLRATLAVVMFAGLARAEDGAIPSQSPAADWQMVITAQVEAFRAKDAAGAFQLAAAPFHAAFPNAEAFFATIIGSGYGPIMDSSSHGFGQFVLLDEHSVAQEVTFTGQDLSRYAAIYVLRQEEAGWRVSGVQLARTPGISV